VTAAPVRARDDVRQWYPLALVFLSVGLSTAMVLPFLTLFLTDAVHASPLQVTAFLIAAPLSSVLVSTVLGHWSDRRPIRRRLIITAAVTGSVGALLTAFIRDYWVLLGLTVTATAVAGSIFPQLFAYARTVLAGSDRAAMTISSLRTVFSLSWVAGPFLATLLVGAGSFTLVYGFAAAMYALAALLAWRALPRPVAVDADGPTPEPVFGPDASGRVIAMTIAAFALLQCAGNLGVQAMSLLITTDLGGDIGDAGLVLGLCAGLEIPLMLGFGLLANRLPLRRLILIGPLFTLMYTLSIAGSQHVWQLAAAQVLNASAIALLQGLGVSYVQDMLPRRPGRASTLFSNAFPIGAMLAGPVLGAAQHYGYRAAYLTGAVLAVAAFALLLIARPARPTAGAARR
jgi:MFS transporter, SET family, sugar efflux transporter